MIDCVVLHPPGDAAAVQLELEGEYSKLQNTDDNPFDWDLSLYEKARQPRVAPPPAAQQQALPAKQAEVYPVGHFVCVWSDEGHPFWVGQVVDRLLVDGGVTRLMLNWHSPPRAQGRYGDGSFTPDYHPQRRNELWVDEVDVDSVVAVFPELLSTGHLPQRVKVLLDKHDRIDWSLA